ncbi:MAG TPA: hypothetical protein VMV05_00210 [bacterium]|nr:hypothetical protein [bacterium]
MKKILILVLAALFLAGGNAWAKKKKPSEGAETKTKHSAHSKKGKGKKGSKESKGEEALFESEITSKDVQFNAGNAKGKKLKAPKETEEESH